ncbi:MAG: cadherin-like domain-containing protein, partial [Clostridia bacterium]|nr:cadherin-like domain-containing protein [Clostridia bacterium]
YTSIVRSTVNPVDDPVVAEDESYTTNEDTPLTVTAPGVLRNDSYPDGFGSLVVVSRPANGTLTLNPDGSFTYTPNPKWYGTDSFVYKLCDADGDCDEAVVTIVVNIVNDPVNAEDVNTRTCVNEGVLVELLASDEDILADGFKDHPISFALLAGPSHGTVSADWTSVVYRTGQAVLSVLYTPDPNFVGTDEFTVRITDPYGSVAVINVRVDVESCGSLPAGATGEVLIGPVVIHELAWAGTTASPQDQWVELLNVTDSPIDLTGWTLRWRKKVPKTEEDLIWRMVELHGVIPAHGFFLLERGHDDVVRDVPADLIYPETMRVGEKEIPLLFSLEGDVVELLDPSGRVVDTANADPRVEGWAAGALVPPRTMERKAPQFPDLQENWWTNLGLVVWGRDANNTTIMGTALALNEPEVLAVRGEPIIVERGQKVELTRYIGERPAEALWVKVVGGDVAGGAASAPNPSPWTSAGIASSTWPQ